MKDKKFDWLMTAIKVLLVTLVLLLIATIKCDSQTQFQLGSKKKDVMTQFGYANFTFSAKSDQNFEIWQYLEDSPLKIFKFFSRKDDVLEMVIVGTKPEIVMVMATLFNANEQLKYLGERDYGKLWVNERHWHKTKGEYVRLYYTISIDNNVGSIIMSLF